MSHKKVLMDMFVVGTIGLFSLGGQRYALKEFDYLLDAALFIWGFRSIRSILRIASNKTTDFSDLWDNDEKAVKLERSILSWEESFDERKFIIGSKRSNLSFQL